MVTAVVKPLVQAHVKVRTDRVEAEGQRRRRQAEVMERVVGSADRLPLVREVVSRAALGIHPAADSTTMIRRVAVRHRPCSRSMI
jgi:hypothetical protein